MLSRAALVINNVPFALIVIPTLGSVVCDCIRRRILMPPHATAADLAHVVKELSPAGSCDSCRSSQQHDSRHE